MGERLQHQIHESRKVLRNPYAYLDGEGRFDALPVAVKSDSSDRHRQLGNPYASLTPDNGFTEPRGRNQSDHVSPSGISLEGILGNKKKGGRFTKSEIQAIARKFQIEVWKRRESIFSGDDKITPRMIVDPRLGLQLLGYRFKLEETLGQYSRGREIFEVAGIIDQSEKHVSISRRFSRDIMNFTTAHELGHAVLHQESGLHRDRAQDGGENQFPRDETEAEADKFAACFLMPEKLVRDAFRDMFLVSNFVINEVAAHSLGYSDILALEKKCHTLRDLTTLLAGAEQYNGRFFNSLAKQFGVSIGAMAIRIEELSLVSM